MINETVLFILFSTVGVYAYKRGIKKVWLSMILLDLGLIVKFVGSSLCYSEAIGLICAVFVMAALEVSSSTFLVRHQRFYYSMLIPSLLVAMVEYRLGILFVVLCGLIYIFALADYTRTFSYSAYRLVITLGLIILAVSIATYNLFVLGSLSVLTIPYVYSVRRALLLRVVEREYSPQDSAPLDSISEIASQMERVTKSKNIYIYLDGRNFIVRRSKIVEITGDSRAIELTKLVGIFWGHGEESK